MVKLLLMLAAFSTASIPVTFNGLQHVTVSQGQAVCSDSLESSGTINVIFRTVISQPGDTAEVYGADNDNDFHAWFYPTKTPTAYRYYYTVQAGHMISLCIFGTYLPFGPITFDSSTVEIIP